MPTAQSTTTASKQTKQIESSQAKSQQQDQAAKSEQPERANSGGNKTPQEQPEYIKQVLIIIEKKVRNLEKRKIKLEEYKESQRKGTVLNEDQQSAVNKFDEVIRTLELTKELEKQFITLANDTAKQQKRQAKKEQIEREEANREKLKEAQKYLSVLNSFQEERVRVDFQNENNEAFKTTETELNAIDEFAKLVRPCQLGVSFESSLNESVDHLISLIEAKPKQISALSSQTTYADLKKLLDNILGASYWQNPVSSSTAQTTTNQESDATNLASEPAEAVKQPEQITNEINALNLKEEISAHTDNLQTEIDQSYNQQNSTDDFVIVSSNDVDKQQQQQQSAQLSPSTQQQQTKTFFTTLNPTDLPANRNINEFLNQCQNNDNGINFLQDSEINSQMQEQQQQNLDYQQQQQQQQFNQHEFNYQQNEQQQQATQHAQQPRDGQFKPRGGGRGGNYSSKPRYSDERRAGGPNQLSGPRQQSNNQPRNMNGQNTFNSANTGFRSNNPGGFRNPANNNNNGPSQGPRQGYYRPSNTGNNNNRNGGVPQQNQQQPRNTQLQTA